MTRQSRDKLRLVGYSLGVALAVVGLFGIAGGSPSANAASNNDKKVGYLLISPASNSIQLHNSDVYVGKMTVQNTTSKDMKVRMSVGSYVIEDDNYDAPKYDSSNKYSLMRNWIKLNADEFTLKTNETREVTYTVVTPSDPPAGSQYATIFAESLPTEQLKGSGIQATSRVGLVLTARMLDGKTIDRANITDTKIDWYQPTSPLKASFGIKNEGNIGTNVNYQLVVKNALNGSKVYEQQRQSVSVYPQTTRRFSLSWDKVGSWFYNVEMHIRLNGGKEHVIKKLVCTIPIWIIVLLIVAIVCLVAYGIINHRARKEIKSNREANRRTSGKASKAKKAENRFDKKAKQSEK